MTVNKERGLIMKATMTELETMYFEEGWDEEGMTFAEFVAILKANLCEVTEEEES